jgi:hypothetical protein
MTTLDLINGEERVLIRLLKEKFDNNRFPFARDLDPKVRRIGQRLVVAEGELWGETRRDYQNGYFESRSDAKPRHDTAWISIFPDSRRFFGTRRCSQSA